MATKKAAAPAATSLAAALAAPTQSAPKLMDPAALQPHALSFLTPEMPGDQVDALAADMRRNGQTTPVALYEGRVLDGRARVKAAVKAGMQISTVTLPAGAAPKAFVYSQNVHRRQLTGVQLARVAVAYMTDNKAQKLSQEEVAETFGLGAKTLRYVFRAVESGNEGLIKLIESPDTTRGELRTALVAAGIMPDVLAKEDIGGPGPEAADIPVLPAKHSSTTQAPDDGVDALLGVPGAAGSTSTQRAAVQPHAADVGHGAAAAKAATRSPSVAAVTHVSTMQGMVDTLARATAQDLDVFYKAALQRGVWKRLEALHAATLAKSAVAKASKGKAKSNA